MPHPQNMQFIVVIIDYYSKFPEILCTTDITSPRIIRWLKEVFARFGYPERLVSDNGPQFTSTLWNNFMKSNGIYHERTPVYHPQWNGLVEVFNRYIKHGVQTFKSTQTQWMDGLLQLLLQFRATSPTPTGFSPAELMFTHKARMPFEVVRSKGGKKAVTGRTTEIQQNNKTEVNKNQTPKFIHRGPFYAGQRVRVKLPHVLKGLSEYSKPLIVKQYMGKWTYKLSDGQVWNAKRLRHVYDPLPGQAAIPTDIGHEEPAPEPLIPRRSSRQNFGVPPQRFSPE